jgi:AcrR family transcriptional regulator
MENGSKLKRVLTDAAVRCFRERGYDDVSVNDICREAGVARSSFYRVFSNKKDTIRCLLEHTDTNSIVSIEELLAAQNDFDRMWLIGDRYITICKSLGPELNATFLSMAAHGEIDMLALGHSVDAWFIRLTRSCQKTGIIRSAEPAELIGPLMVDMVYHEIYAWSANKGDYPLRARARRVTEALVNVAPEYRWSEAQLAAADKS